MNKFKIGDRVIASKGLLKDIVNGVVIRTPYTPNKHCDWHIAADACCYEILWRSSVSSGSLWEEDELELDIESIITEDTAWIAIV